MATDKSEPRVGVIFKVGILAVVTLVALRAALVTYFDRAAQAEEQRKFGDVKPEALQRLRADEKARLAGGAMPIENAMQQIAARGRMSASPDIMPTASKDLSALQGWIKMPSQVPSALAVPAEPSASPAAGSRADGGTSTMSDAAARKAAVPEGGTFRNHP